MPDTPETIERFAERLEAVRSRVRDAAARASRDPREVRIVGVTKTIAPERIRVAYDAGIRDLGENYVTELRAKQPLFPEATWHFIGTLQAGSARHVARHADVVQTLAPGSAVERLSARLATLERSLPCLVEVDLTGDRPGVPPADLAAFVQRARELPGIRVTGLMTLPPADSDPEAARPFFRRLRDLRDGLRESHPEVLDLSMGMSLDYEVAVEEGATMVRLGTVLFGERR